MDIFIIVFIDGTIKVSNDYTPMLKRLIDEGKVKSIVNISKPTDPRIYDGNFWRKLHIVG